MPFQGRARLQMDTAPDTAWHPDVGDRFRITASSRRPPRRPPRNYQLAPSRSGSAAGGGSGSTAAVPMVPREAQEKAASSSSSWSAMTAQERAPYVDKAAASARQAKTLAGIEVGRYMVAVPPVAVAPEGAGGEGESVVVVDYATHSLKEPQAACRAKALVVGGTKAVLRARLEAAEAAPAGGGAGAPAAGGKKPKGGKQEQTEFWKKILLG